MQMQFFIKLTLIYGHLYYNIIGHRSFGVFKSAL